MKPLLLAVPLLAALVAVVAVAVPPERPGRDAAPVPVLVELFTSEGCSSCPPADALLAELVSGQPVAGATVVPLAFHVDYWDRLGWADPFASAWATRRQHDYAAAFGNRNVYTPQMVVDGRAELVGSDRAKALAAIRAAAATPKASIDAAFRFDGKTVRVESVALGRTAGLAGDCDVTLAVVEDGLSSDVRRGENRGRTLAHAAVVRRLEPFGQIAPGKSLANRTSLTPGDVADPTRLSLVAFAREPATGRIVAASSQRLVAE